MQKFPGLVPIVPGRPAKSFELLSITSWVHAVATGIENLLENLINSFSVDDVLIPVPARIRGFFDFFYN